MQLALTAQHMPSLSPASKILCYGLQWFKEGRQAATIQAAALKPAAAEGTPQADAAAGPPLNAVKVELAAEPETCHAASAGTAEHKGYVSGVHPDLKLPGPASCKFSMHKTSFFGAPGRPAQLCAK